MLLFYFWLQVIDLSQYSPTYFGPEHAQVLSSHLLHSSLPGLTRLEQMSLMALADTIATTSTDLKVSQDKSKGTVEKRKLWIESSFTAQKRIVH